MWSQHQAPWCTIDTLPILNKYGEWWRPELTDHNKIPIKRQREKILMTPLLRLLYLLRCTPPPRPVLSTFLSSLSFSPPPVCSRRQLLTAGAAGMRWALTASSAGLGRWAIVTSAALAPLGPVSATMPSLWWLANSMVKGLSEAVGCLLPNWCWEGLRNMVHYTHKSD